MDYKSKIEFVTLHLWASNSSLEPHSLFQNIIYPAYYLQLIFYMAATLKLIFVVKKNIHSKPVEIMLVRYLLFYVTAVVVIEFSVIINSFFIEDILTRLTIEQSLSIVFLFICLYIGIKQSIIIVQAKLTQYAESVTPQVDKAKQHANEVNTHTIGGQLSEIIAQPTIEKVSRNQLSEIQKDEIKQAIENYFRDSRIYLDPNLKLEVLSKKIHITARRISMVINDVYGTNFNQFINEYRISEAIKQISQNHKKVIIENIYTKVGFNSRSAFNNAFKEYTGLSPAEYLKGNKVTNANN